jgi:protein O-mannosyl-transferase
MDSYTKSRYSFTFTFQTEGMSKKTPIPVELKKEISNPVRPFFLRKSLMSWVIAVAAFLVYANTLGHEYTQDDSIVIVDNMFTTKGVSGWGGLLKYDTFYGFFKEEGKASLVSGGRYRPFTPMIFALGWQLWGDNAFMFHLLSVLLFSFTCVVLYRTLSKLLVPRFQEETALLIAGITSILFALHPIHTEAVANIKGLDETMALLLSLLSLYSVLKIADGGPKWWTLVGAISFFIGLMSKENTITFLGIIPMALYYFRNFSFGKSFVSALPLIGSTVLFLIIRTSVLGSAAGVGEPPMELMNNPFVKVNGAIYTAFSAGEKLATILFTLGKYFLLMLWPHPLTHDYYPRHIEIMTMSSSGSILSLLLYLTLAGLAVFSLKNKQIWGFGIWWYLMSLSIISNIVFPVGTNMSERFLFMPGVGILLIIAFYLTKFSWDKEGMSTRKIGVIPTVILLVLCLGYAGKTFTRNTAWKNNFTLFTTDVEVSKNSAKLNNAVGGELTSLAGKLTDTLARSNKAKEAIPYLEKALSIHPNYKNAWLILGNAYNYTGQLEKSIQSYRQSLKVDPTYKEGKGNLAITLLQAGRYYGEQKGDIKKAITYLEESFSLNPKEGETARLLGVAYGMSGNGPKASDFFKIQTMLDPENGQAWYDLGTAYLAIGRTQEGNEARAKAETLRAKSK